MIVGIIGPVLTYLVAAKKLTGEVKTSDASELWAESRSIREWSAERIAQLTGTITALETRINSVEKREDSLLDENKKLSEKLHEMERRLEELEKRNSRLMSENERLLEQVQTLTDTVEALRQDIMGYQAAVTDLTEELRKSKILLQTSEDRVDVLEEEADTPDADRRKEDHGT